MNCLYCNKFFENEKLLSLHQNKCNLKNTILECYLCHKQYKELHLHLKKCNQIQIFQKQKKNKECPICEKSIFVSLKKHLTTCNKNIENEKIKCIFCNKKYKISSNHIKFCSKNPENTKSKCNYCGKTVAFLSIHLEFCFKNYSNIILKCDTCSNFYALDSEKIECCEFNIPINILESFKNHLPHYTNMSNKMTYLLSNVMNENYEINENSLMNENPVMNEIYEINENSVMNENSLTDEEIQVPNNEKIFLAIIDKLKDEWENVDFIETLEGYDTYEEKIEKIEKIIKYFNYENLDDLIHSLDLQCSICCYFTDNKTIPCNHTVCSKCVNILQNNYQDYSCPICREEIF